MSGSTIMSPSGNDGPFACLDGESLLSVLRHANPFWQEGVAGARPRPRLDFGQRDYLYAFILDARRVKIGRSKNPARRLKDPEYDYLEVPPEPIFCIKLADVRTGRLAENLIENALSDLRIGKHEIYILPALAAKIHAAVLAFRIFVAGILARNGFEQSWPPKGWCSYELDNVNDPIENSAKCEVYWRLPADIGLKVKGRPRGPLSPELRRRLSEIQKVRFQDPAEKKN
jgi:hypothetical protein